MNVRTDLLLDETTFFPWLERQERKYELVEGRPVMSPGASGAHVTIVPRIARLLADQLDPETWLTTWDFAVRIAPKRIRYPDVVVVPVTRFDLKGHSTSEPALIVEVLSPSTAELDLGIKANEYLGLPTLEAYLVFSQSESRAYCWVKRDGSFPPGPIPVEGTDQTVTVPRLAISLPLADIYRGLLPEARTPKA